MARGRDKHQAHRAAVAALGRSLSRRARSACEVCGDSGRLDVVEVQGNPEPEPEEAWAILACSRCQEAMEGRWEAGELHFLQTAVWSDVRPAQLVAVRLARKVAESGVTWARDLLEGLYLDEETEALL